MAKINATSTCFSITDTAPATLDLAGFQAVPAPDWDVYSLFRAVSDQIQTRAVTEKTDMCTGLIDSTTGAINFGSMQVTLAYDPLDAAQATSTAQWTANSVVYLREIDDAGNTFWYKAIITTVTRGRVEGDEVTKIFDFKLDLVIFDPV